MALLDQLLAASAFGVPTPGFDALDAAAGPQFDPAAEAAAAREAAAQRLARGIKRQPAPFTADAVPFGGVGAGMLSGILGGGPQPSADLPPPTNDPTSGEPQPFSGGVPIPRPRPFSAPADDVLPSNSTPATDIRAPFSMAPSAPEVAGGTLAPRGPASGGGFSLGNFLKPENAPILMAMAGGFAGAPSFGTGMRRAFSGATPPAMQLAQTIKQNQSQAATYQALLAKGVPPQEAMAAVLDPNVMKATAAKYFETKPLTPVTNEDMFGNKTHGSFDPNSGKYLDAAGRPITAGGAATAATGGVAGMPANVDNSLMGDDYLGQFPKEVQAAVKNYVRGDSMPTGNPRKGFTQAVKMIAQKYGEDTGIPVSDQKYVERRQFRNQLASGTSGVGAQRNALRQGLEHLEGVTNSAEALGNWDLGLTPLTKGVNWARGLTTGQQAKVNDMRNKVQQLSGEMGKFFSGSAGGGVHEREATRQRFEAVSSPQELAAAIDSSLELLEGGLHAREQQRDEILGPNSGVEILSAKDKERVQRIRDLSARLRGGGAAAAPAAPPAGTTKSGINWSVVQ